MDHPKKVVRPISEFQHIQFSTEIIGLSVDKKESSHYEAQSKLDIVENESKLLERIFFFISYKPILSLDHHIVFFVSILKQNFHPMTLVKVW